jgi:hypothetical protein
MTTATPITQVSAPVMSHLSGQNPSRAMPQARDLRVAKDYRATMTKDPTLQSKCEGAYPNIRVQQLKTP